MSDLLSMELIQLTQGKAQRNNVSDLAFQQIWLAIVKQELLCNEVITEQALAKKYSISRTPLREAIQKLINIGLITRLANRTLIVSELNIEHMNSLSTTRECLEGLIARNVWQRLQQGVVSIDGLILIHQRMQMLIQVSDAEMMLSLGIKFHEEMCQLSNNKVAVDMLQQLLLALEPYRRLIIGHAERLESIVSEHDEIIQCLKGDDEESVDKLMRQHIAAARHFYREHLDLPLNRALA